MSIEDIEFVKEPARASRDEEADFHDTGTVDETPDEAADEAVDEGYVSDRERIAAKYRKAEDERRGLTQTDEADEVDEAVEEAETEVESKPDEVEVNVNGRKYMVTQDKIDKAGGIQTYQKVAAANEGLHELAKQRKLLEKERYELDELRRANLNTNPPQGDLPNESAVPNPPKEEVSTPKADKELVKQYHTAVYDGDDDKAAELFQKIMVDTRTPAQPATQVEQLDPEAVANIAADKIRSELKDKQAKQDSDAELARAQQNFFQEFADVASNPQSMELANAMTITLMSEHPNWTPSQITRQAGLNIREYTKSLAVVTEPATPKPDPKVGMKRAINSVKAAGGRARAKPQPKPQTRSDYVASLKQQRGQ